MKSLLMENLLRTNPSLFMNFMSPYYVLKKYTEKSCPQRLHIIIGRKSIEVQRNIGKKGKRSKTFINKKIKYKNQVIFYHFN